MTLSDEQKVQLSELFQSSGARVLKEVIQAKIVEVAVKEALNSRTTDYTAERRGFCQGIEWVYKELRDINAEVEKLEQKQT